MVCTIPPWHLVSQALTLDLPTYSLQSIASNNAFSIHHNSLWLKCIWQILPTFNFLYLLLPATGELSETACYYYYYLHVCVQRSSSCLNVFSVSCTLWVCISQKIALSVIPQTQTTFLGDKVLTGLKLAKQAKLAGQWAPVIYLFVFLALRLEVCTTMSGFFMWVPGDRI